MQNHLALFIEKKTKETYKNKNKIGCYNCNLIYNSSSNQQLNYFMKEMENKINTQKQTHTHTKDADRNK